MKNMIITKGINETLDLRILEFIINTLQTMGDKKVGEDIDYLQVFETNGNKLINSSEMPEKKEEYILPFKYEENTVIWAMHGIDEKYGEYWTIMYPSEY